MKILLDQCVPVPLRKHLPAHDVFTVYEMGWADKKNGELLKLIGPEAFLTVDQNIRYQNKLSNLSFAVVVLAAQTNREVDLVPLIDRVHEALKTAKPGEFVEIQA